MKYEYISELAPEYIYITDAATSGILIQVEDPDHMVEISISLCRNWQTADDPARNGAQ